MSLCFWKMFVNSAFLMFLSLAAATSDIAVTSADNNIAFDVPDLISLINITKLDGVVREAQIEAFKTVINDRIMVSSSGGCQARCTELSWVSVGYPTLVSTAETVGTQGSMFRQTPWGFQMFIQMLTMAHRRELAERASHKYRTNITAAQITLIPLSKLECYIVLNEERTIKGSVANFGTYPLTMDFHMRHTSPEASFFKSTVQNGTLTDSMLVCSMESQGKQTYTNTLTINGATGEEIDIQGKLFGPARRNNDEVYVTRHQATVLAREVYSSMHIFEEYDMPQDTFTENFLQDLINIVATQTFTHVPAAEAFSQVSSFGFNIDEDLKPDGLIRKIGNILKVKKIGNKPRIVVDESFRNELQTDNVMSSSGSVGYGAFQVSAQWAERNSLSNATNSKSLNEQLIELNMVSKEDVQWQRKGYFITPTTINVARISRAKLASKLTFSRIKIRRSKAAFIRNFTFYTRESTPCVVSTAVKQMQERVDTLSYQVDTFVSRMRIKHDDDIRTLARWMANLTMRIHQLEVGVVTSCPADFVSTTGVGCYKLVTEPMSWQDAVNRCQALHISAHLVVISSEEEHNAIAHMLSTHYPQSAVREDERQRFWTAGQRRDTSTISEFVWKIPISQNTFIFTENQMNFVAWADGAPSNYSRGRVESCAAISCVEQCISYKWNDVHCSAKWLPVCEIDI